MAKQQQKMISPRPAEGTPRATPTHEEIARRAYERFVSRGGQHGSEMDDWIAAEQELKQQHRR